MAHARPFHGHVVKPEWVSEVGSPAYDAMSTEARRAHREAHPLSYLHVTRSAPDEPDAATVDNATLVARGRASLERLLDVGVFEPEVRTAYLLYELSQDGHTQRGVVCEVPGSAFLVHARPHEATRPERSALLAEHFLHVRAASSPVACTIEDGTDLRVVGEATATTEPLVDITGDDGLRQRVWTIDDAHAALVQEALDAPLYIIDGHHRASANAQLLERGHNVPLLVAVFPADDLRLDGFHRLVARPAGIDDATILERIRRRFRVEVLDEPVAPAPNGVNTVLGGTWYRVHFDERPISGGPLVHLGALDPAVCEREIIDALFTSPGNAADVAYMPDQGDPVAPAHRAAAEDRVPLLVPAVTVADMIAVADAGHIMPAKSTYFVPKVRSGLFLRRYEDELG